MPRYLLLGFITAAVALDSCRLALFDSRFLTQIAVTSISNLTSQLILVL